MDYKVQIMICILFAIPTIFSENEHTLPTFIHTRGFGKRTFDLDREEILNTKVKRGLLGWTIFKMGSKLKEDDIRSAGHSEKKNQNENLDNQKLFFRIH
jgi:hypothetical protein